jgi:hypothetical protein
VHKLHEEKRKSTGLRAEVIKRIMTGGFYGKFLEVRQYEKEDGEESPMGPLFNPVYGAEIEAGVRMQVAELCLRNNIMPIHIAVDGVLVDSEIPVENTGVLGTWKLANTGPAIVIGTGAVAMGGKKGKGDFSLDYDWLKAKLEEDPEATEFTMSQLSPVTLAVTVNQNKWEKLGELERIERRVELGYERKRCYRRQEVRAKDILNGQEDSVPWDAGMLVRGAESE